MLWHAFVNGSGLQYSVFRHSEGRQGAGNLEESSSTIIKSIDDSKILYVETTRNVSCAFVPYVTDGSSSWSVYAKCTAYTSSTIRK